MTRPSPAAAAAVSRRLREAGVRRQVEFPGRVFTGGFAVDPTPDCIEVAYYTDDLTGTDLAGLLRCEEVLKPHYDVSRVDTELVVPGGYVKAPVLEVRSDRWGW